MLDRTSLDYLEKIRNKLWSRKKYGSVGLMVGAGFSRNAEFKSLNAHPFPTWPDLAKKLHHELYPSVSKNQSSSQNLDPIRIASQYEATFSRVELNRLLQKIIPDDDYSPGKLHKMLLKLPWTDIFTTNYDTLLERTLRFVHDRKYNVIRKIDSIHDREKPRIVKLHGSFPDSFPFIITEENYRRYPVDFAPFVNMVQQSLVENIFCLIGFSGEDPNFLNWTGWIRDNLGKNAPKIYLIGVFDLHEPEKKLFEQRSVIPIDLAPLFPKEKWSNSSERSSKALEWFLFYLKKGAPLNPMLWPVLKQIVPFYDSPDEKIPEIPDSKESRYAEGQILSLSSLDDDQNKSIQVEKKLIQILKRWKIERKNYPNWVVAPTKTREILWDYTNQLIKIIIENIDRLAWPKNLELIYELNWRLEKCLIPLHREWVKPIVNILESNTPGNFERKMDDKKAMSRIWLQVAFSILRNARERFEDGKYKIWLERIERICSQINEMKEQLYYEKCLYNLYRMDFTEALTIVSNWPEFLRDPHWELKRIAILIELGEIKDAYAIGEKILKNIRQSEDESQLDYFLYSLEGWLIYLMDQLDDTLKNWIHFKEKKTQYKEIIRDYWQRFEELNVFKCNPHPELELFEIRLKSEKPEDRKAFEISEEFDPGVPSSFIHKRYYGGISYFDKIFPAFQFLRLLEDVGLPFFSPHINLYSGSELNAAEWIKDYFPIWSISALVRSNKQYAVDRWFDRVSTASLDKKVIDKIYPMLISAWQNSIQIMNKRSQQQSQETLDSSSERFAILTDIISRLCFRFSEKGLKMLINNAIDLYKSPFIRNWKPKPFHIYEALGKIFRRVLYAMPYKTILQIIPDLLSLPIPSNKFKVDYIDFWPEPLKMVEWSSGVKLPKNYNRKDWDKPIDNLISVLKSGDILEKKLAVTRLRKIKDISGFTEREKNKIALALWNTTFIHSDGLPDYWGLSKCFLLHWPSPDKKKTKELIKQYLLNKPIRDIKLSSFLKVSKPLIGNIKEDRDHIFWKQNEVVKIAEKVCQKWDEEKTQFDKGNIDSLKLHELHNLRNHLRLIPDIFAEIIFIELKDIKDDKLKRKIYTLFEEIEEKDLSANAAKPGLLFTDTQLISLVASEIKKGLNSLDLNTVGNSVKGIYNWLCYCHLFDFFPKIPHFLLDELIWMFCYRRQPGLFDVMSYIAKIIDNLPEILSDEHIKSICIAIDSLLEDTNLDSIKGKEKSGFKQYIPVKELPDYKGKVSWLVFVLANNLEGKIDQETLKKWRKMLENDHLPEVRKFWD